jgi:hypothetical protein
MVMVVGTVVVTVFVFVTVSVLVTGGFVTVAPALVLPGSVTVFFFVTVTFTLRSTVVGFAETATILVVPFFVIVDSFVAADELGSDPIATPSAAPRTISSDPPAIVANAFEPRINRSVSMPALESTLPRAWHE